MRVVFMGTPDFAVPCLERLAADGHDVVGVFTQPDKPVGRKQLLTPPPVKLAAEKLGFTVFQPGSMRNGEAADILRRLAPELIVVTAYGKILPPDILSLPEHGCINIHASLLPKLRGAAPIQWAVISGEKETGVTSMQMDAGLDTGDMLLQEKIEIGENDTAEQVHDSLSQLGAQVLSKTLEALAAGELHPKKQDDSLSTYAPMLDKNLSPIDWNETALNVHNRIRGLSPWPAASCVCAGKKIKVYESRLSDIPGGSAGEIIISDGRLIVSCADGKCVELLSLQSEGKSRLPAADFLRGFRIPDGLGME